MLKLTTPSHLFNDFPTVFSSFFFNILFSYVKLMLLLLFVAVVFELQGLVFLHDIHFCVCLKKLALLSKKKHKFVWLGVNLYNNFLFSDIMYSSVCVYIGVVYIKIASCIVISIVDIIFCIYIHLIQIFVCGEILNKKRRILPSFWYAFSPHKSEQKEIQGGIIRIFEMCDTLFT